MKKILSVVLTLIMVFSLGAAALAEEEFVIGFDMNDNTCAYCLQFATYIEELAIEEGLTQIINNVNADVATQITNVENMLAQGARVVAGIWGDKDAALPVADLCKAQDAVCVATLTSLSNEGNGYENYVYLGSENYDGGYLQGEYLVDQVEAGALEAPLQIWYLSSAAGDQQCLDRQEGMEAALKDAGIEYEIVAFEYTNNMMDEGLMVMENWVQVYDDISIVVGSADLSVLGAITAYEAAGRDVEAVTWVGLDGQDVALESMAEGKMDMTVYQNAYAQAEAFIEMCKQVRDGVDPATIEDINVPFEPITVDNLADYYTAE